VDSKRIGELEVEKLIAHSNMIHEEISPSKDQNTTESDSARSGAVTTDTGRFAKSSAFEQWIKWQMALR